jgi:hypothetical protein
MARLDAEIMSNPDPFTTQNTARPVCDVVSLVFWSFDAYPIIMMVPGSHGE